MEHVPARFHAGNRQLREGNGPDVLNVQPRRLELVSVSRPSSVNDLVKQYPSTVSPQVVALINRPPSGTTLPAGELFKRIVGGPSF
jgi:hypothetical protein